jgi:hypothetical protein
MMAPDLEAVRKAAEHRWTISHDAYGARKAAGVISALQRDLAALLRMHDRRVADLLEANNRYQQEARDARAALKAATADPVPAVPADTPVAFRVHDFHVARMPVKARGKFPEPTEFLYPASREQDARNAARLVGGTCTPLYPADWQRGVLVRDDGPRPYHGLTPPPPPNDAELVDGLDPAIAGEDFSGGARVAEDQPDRSNWARDGGATPADRGAAGGMAKGYGDD